MTGMVEVALGLLETKDGKHIAVGNVEPYFWERFCKALGRADLAGYQYAQGEKAHEVCSAVRQIMLTKTRDEWVQILKEADTCVAPVLDPDEVISDPHVLHRQLVMELDHPTLGRVKQIGFPIKLSDTPGRVQSFAPTAGQHTQEILQGLGYTEEQIDRMRRSGAIR
jgi:crotonobetainyl-CoA:carnitine CoA-transferase CaiB-like acyl-CoA transferase